jgi:hypothetical protein
MEKYKCKRLPMGIKIAWFLIFFKVMSKLVQGMENVETHLVDFLMLTNNSFKDHLLNLEIVLANLTTIVKSYFI